MRQPRFDRTQNFVAARGFIFAGVTYAKDDPFLTDGVDLRMLQRQYETRAVNMTSGEAIAPDPVQMKPAPKKGYYIVSAPWLAADETLRGKAKAEARVKELRDAGPPEPPEPPADEQAGAGTESSEGTTGEQTAAETPAGEGAGEPAAGTDPGEAEAQPEAAGGGTPAAE